MTANQTALLVAWAAILPAAAGGDSSGTPPREIDLLAKIDPQRDVVLGKWGIVRGVLTAAAGPAEPWRIEIPFAPPDEYDLRVVVERKEGNPPFVVGLPVGTCQITVDFDGWSRNDKCGISSIDGRSGEDNETCRLGKLLTNDQPSTILCAVRKGAIRVVIDRRTVIDWKGDRARLSLWPGWKVRHLNIPFLATWGGRFTVSRIGLTPVGGAGKDVR